MDKGRPRRTQADRSAATRKLLLNATIKCLFEHGYGATTTILVAKEAGVSRGAMLHQFPSKADLMTFVVEEVFAQEKLLYAEILAGIDDPAERLVAYPSAVWKVLSRPAGVAVLEILQGSRSDPTLLGKLAPVQARIEEHAREGLEREFPGGVSMALLQLIVGAVRGLSITKVMAPERQDVVRAVELLSRLFKMGVASGFFSKLEPPAPKGKISKKKKAKRSKSKS